jgi:hypothetical protein
MLSFLFRRRKPVPILDERTSAEMTRLEACVDEFARNEEKLFEAIEERQAQQRRQREDSKPAVVRGVLVVPLSDNAA